MVTRLYGLIYITTNCEWCRRQKPKPNNKSNEINFPIHLGNQIDKEKEKKIMQNKIVAKTTPKYVCKSC